MKTFNSLEEMQPYYNEHTNTYEFIENQKIIDVKFDFILKTAKSIYAKNITAKDIDANNINAWNINANNINACEIEAGNINAKNIDADNINACGINAKNINAKYINAWNINAKNIEFYAVCFAYETFVCDNIKGRRENSKYFCLDSDVVINKKED